MLILISSTVYALEYKDYRDDFNSSYLRQKFGLSESEDEGYYRRQREYEDARETDYQILINKMKNYDSNED